MEAAMDAPVVAAHWARLSTNMIVERRAPSPVNQIRFIQVVKSLI